MIAGSNHVNSAGDVTGTAAAIGTKPTVGIDVSSIGGMYANKISLIATETGVGVSNLGDGTYNGAISIDTAGTVNNTNGNMNAAGDIEIKASFTNNGHIAGNKNVNITVAGTG